MWPNEVVASGGRWVGILFLPTSLPVLLLFILSLLGLEKEGDNEESRVSRGCTFSSNGMVILMLLSRPQRGLGPGLSESLDDKEMGG